MRKHVIQFEIDVPDTESQKVIKDSIKALLDLLEYKSKNLQIDPPPDVRIVREPIDTPMPWKPYTPPSAPYSPKPLPGPLAPWSTSEDPKIWMKHARDKINELKNQLNQPQWELAKADQLKGP